MELTVGQINEARSGYFKGNKWGNERNETNTKGVVPYRFHDQITEQEREVVEIILDRFNKDLALYLARCNANHRDLSLNF